MRKVAILAVAAGWAGCVVAGPSLCAVDEEVVFSCPLGRRVVSLCGTVGVNSSKGSVTYRIGRPGRTPELVFPQTRSDPKMHFRGRSLLFSGGGGAFVSFDRGSYTYTVFTAIGRGWGPKEGVDAPGRPRIYLPCRGAAESLLGDDWFGRAGIPIPATDFELP